MLRPRMSRRLLVPVALLLALLASIAVLIGQPGQHPRVVLPAAGLPVDEHERRTIAGFWMTSGVARVPTGRSVAGRIVLLDVHGVSPAVLLDVLELAAGVSHGVELLALA